MAYVLQAMMFYDAGGGRKRTGLANDYQGFTDLSGLLKTGRAVLVAMPPQDGSCRGAELLCGPVPKTGEPDNRQPLGTALDRHTTIYRFILPVTTPQPQPREWTNRLNCHIDNCNGLTLPSMIKTQDLTKIYGELHALDNLTLELE